MHRPLYFLIALTLLFTACSQSTAPEAAPLNGTTWVLQKIDDTPITEITTDRVTQVILWFPNDSSFMTHAPNNEYGGIYRVDGTNLSLTGFGGTKVYGHEEDVKAEERYIAALKAVTRYKAEREIDEPARLLLYYPNGTLEYKAE